MCIIAVKIKGADFAPVDIIRNCIEANPHGFAIAWNEGGILHTFKTMDKDEALAKYTEVSRLDPDETACIFHARIATHGSKCVAHCHCWDHEGRYAFAHNGVLHNIGSRDDLTDSETFFRDFFVPAYEKVGPDYAFKLASVIAESGGRNKFALLMADGHVWLKGEYIKGQFPGCRGKVYFSNGTYMPRSRYGFDASVFAAAARPVPQLPDREAIRRAASYGAYGKPAPAKSASGKKGSGKKTKAEEGFERDVKKAMSGTLFEV